MKPAIALSDAERFPLIDDLSFLFSLRQDEAAPLYNFKSGDRLTGEHLKKVNEYAAAVQAQKPFWERNELPLWLPAFTEQCRTTVPFYKNRPASFYDQPTIRRSDIKTAPWNFVGNEVSLADLLVYQTSGTTGPAMDVMFDPVSQACWLPQLQSVLSSYNIKLPTGSGTVAIALICSQAETLTYASLSAYLGGAGILKLNLAPAGWQQPSHRCAYLEKHNPAVLTGDPFAFSDLLELSPDIHPKAIVSSAMKLGDGLRKRLEERFQCPVLDIYSLTECRMVAVADGTKHRAIRPDLYLEIFDADEDNVLAYGAKGELVITGGNNPFLPLMRYRTGDFCSLEMRDGLPFLTDLEGRAMVVFHNQRQELINTINLSRAMMEYPLAGFTLHQYNNKSLSFTGWSREPESADVIKETLHRIFGDDIGIEVFIFPPQQGPSSKPVFYSSDFVF